MTLRGYSLPLSPTGRSSLVPPPPWHFAGEVLLVEYRADPAAVRAFLPEGIEPVSDDGDAAVIFGDWQSCTDSGDELLDPVRSQYKECYIALGCRIDGSPAVRAAFTWVDKDFSLVRGLIQGYPKKFGSIWITRDMGVGRSASPRVEPGGRFGATLAASDRRLIDVEVVLEEPADAPTMMTVPLVHTRHFPTWDLSRSATTELVVSGSAKQEVADVWRGSGRIDFHHTPTDELDALAPVEIGHAYRLRFAETLTQGRVLG